MELIKFNQYKTLFNTNLEKTINDRIKNKEIIEMIMYSLDGGKRLRPIIAMAICNSLCNNINNVLNFSVAIELIHTSSLIIDDLPCMDDDNYRRNKLSFHCKYSVVKAQLVSEQLINTSMSLILDTYNKEDYTIIIQNIFHNLGLMGAAGGQLLDLTPITTGKKEVLNNFKNKDKIKELFKKKTTSFFEIAFLGGFLAGGGDRSQIDKLIEAANYFGLAFQIYDDFDDTEQDKQRETKQLQDPNFINNFGKDEAFDEFIYSLNQFEIIMDNLGINTDVIKELCYFLKYKVGNRIKNI